MEGTSRTVAWVRDFVYLLALATWTGGSLYFSFLATPAIFGRFERPVAGDVVGALFPGYYRLALVSGVALAAAAAARLVAGRPAAALALVLAVAVLVANAVGALVLQPRIHDLRLQLRAAGAGAGGADVPAPELQQLFGRLHGLSMALNLVSFLAAVAAWVTVAARGL